MFNKEMKMDDVPAAQRYVRAIKNPVKREYAYQVLRYIAGIADKPERPTGLSVMAAQAVRLQLANFIPNGRTV
jgi:hypothetical protein